MTGNMFKDTTVYVRHQHQEPKRACLVARTDKTGSARCPAHVNDSLHPHGSLLHRLSMSNILSSTYHVTLGSMAAGTCGVAGGTPATDGFAMGMTPSKYPVPGGKAAAWASTLHATVGLTV